MVTVRVAAGELMRRLEPAVDREQLAQALDDRVRVDEALGVSSESAKAGDAIAVMTRVAALFPARRLEAGRPLVEDTYGCGKSGADRL